MTKKRSSQEGWKQFVALCAEISSPQEMQKCLDLFFTLEEKETLGKRLNIVRALREGKLTQREIADHYDVSISQITRGSNALKIIDPALESLLDRFLHLDNS